MKESLAMPYLQKLLVLSTERQVSHNLQGCEHSLLGEGRATSDLRHVLYNLKPSACKTPSKVPVVLHVKPSMNIHVKLPMNMLIPLGILIIYFASIADVGIVIENA